MSNNSVEIDRMKKTYIFSIFISLSAFVLSGAFTSIRDYGPIYNDVHLESLFIRIKFYLWWIKQPVIKNQIQMEIFDLKG